MTLEAAFDLRIFDIIAKSDPGAKLSSLEIASQIGTKNPEAPMMLDRILSLLTAHSVLLSSQVAGNEPHHFKRVYSLSPISKYFVTDREGGSLVPMMALMHSKVFESSGKQLKDAVVEGGIPFNRAHGMHTFEYAASDPKFNQVFNSAMFNHTTIVINRMLDFYKGFEGIGQLVDVGGGSGMALSFITSRYPHIKGVDHIGGDMFAGVPSGDAIFIMGVLHNWDDERCVKVLKNCYNAIPDSGKVMVVASILPIEPETSITAKMAYQSDVIMMTNTPGGKERNIQEYEALATGAGFTGVKNCFAGYGNVIEFLK